MLPVSCSRVHFDSMQKTVQRWIAGTRNSQGSCHTHKTDNSDPRTAPCSGAVYSAPSPWGPGFPTGIATRSGRKNLKKRLNRMPRKGIFNQTNREGSWDRGPEGA